MTTRSERLRTIAVVTDFAPEASAALAWALELAREHEATSIVVHALLHETPPALELAPIPGGYYRELLAGARAKLEATMAEVRPAGLSIAVELVLASGVPAILATAEQRQADVIVLDIRAGAGWKRRRATSTTTQLVRAALLPVLSVPAGNQPHERATRTILVPTTLSPDAPAAAATALHLLAGSGGGRVVLLHAVAAGRSRAAARQAIDAVAQALRVRAAAVAQDTGHPPVRVEAELADGPVPQVVVQQASRIHADVIALGTHDRSAVERLWLRSTAEHVLSNAPCPIVTVRTPHA